MKKLFLLLLLTLLSFSNYNYAQPLYFPPISSTANWETTDPATLEWCPERINNLYTFLEQENTKGFIILKDLTKVQLKSNTENLKKCEKIKIKNENEYRDKLILDERRTKSIYP
jgi:hypothetical protein